MLTGPEKRHYPRIPIDLFADLRAVAVKLADQSQPASITDISQGGVFIETEVNFDSGDLIAFEVKLPTDNRKRTVLGLVRWHKTTDPTGIGVEFVKTHLEAGALVDEFLGEHGLQTPPGG